MPIMGLKAGQYLDYPKGKFSSKMKEAAKNKHKEEFLKENEKLFKNLDMKNPQVQSRMNQIKESLDSYQPTSAELKAARDQEALHLKKKFIKGTLHTPQYTTKSGSLIANEKYKNANLTIENPTRKTDVKKAVDKTEELGLDVKNVKVSATEKLDDALKAQDGLGVMIDGEVIITNSDNLNSVLNNKKSIVSQNPTDATTHELGHYADEKGLYDRKLTKKDGTQKELDSKILKYQRGVLNQEAKEIAARVSPYAATNRSEFIAETIAGISLGKKYDPEVMRMYVALKGPKMTNVPEYNQALESYNRARLEAARAVHATKSA